MNQLFFFTSSYPYGLGENWKKAELEVFSPHFNKIFLLPFTYAGNERNPKAVPGNTVVFTPALLTLSNAKRHVLKVLFSPRLRYYCKEAFVQKVYQKKHWFTTWAVACVQTELALRSTQLKDAISRADKESIWYFYWGFEWAYIIPFLKKKGFRNIFFRVHGPDIYEERDGNNGYIPFRKPLYHSAKAVVVLSEQAKKYVQAKNYQPAAILIAPLGTESAGLAGTSNDNVLRLVTCSRIAAVKRLTLLAAALHYADMPVIWTHIGDGPLRGELEKSLGGLPSHVQFHFTGQLKPEEVNSYYQDKLFDLFVNVSSSEGAPVAIMEAFAAGIPVIATAVGGVPEMVNESNGGLLPEDITPECLWQKLKTFKNEPAEVQRERRLSAYKTYEQSFRAAANAEKLAQYFLSAQQTRL